MKVFRICVFTLLLYFRFVLLAFAILAAGNVVAELMEFIKSTDQSVSLEHPTYSTLGMLYFTILYFLYDKAIRIAYFHAREF